MGELFTSNVAITLYVSVFFLLINWLKQRQKWDTERWDGIIATGFALAEKSGLKTGNEKLNHAIVVFTQKYRDTYGKEPNPMDLKDAVLDFGRLALEYKMSGAGK